MFDESLCRLNGACIEVNMMAVMAAEVVRIAWDDLRLLLEDLLVVNLRNRQSSAVKTVEICVLFSTLPYGS